MNKKPNIDIGPKPYLITYLMNLVVFCGMTLCLTVSASFSNESSTEEGFSSVEERRLHATIQEEREIILEEKKAIALKEKELKTLEDAVDKKLAEIDEKLVELQNQTEELAELLAQKDVAELQKIQDLSKIYEKMDPTKAALALTGLDQKTAAEILAQMKVKAAAKILDSLSKQKATELSKTFSTIQRE
jgi:flagellar motility protein MotE (MotC chaperone)